MQLLHLALLPLAAANALGPQHISENPSELTYKIPTSYESAVQARRILHLTPLGTLATVFPSEHSHSTSEDDAGTSEQRPQSLAGMPIGLMGMCIHQFLKEVLEERVPATSPYE